MDISKIASTSSSLPGTRSLAGDSSRQSSLPRQEDASISRDRLDSAVTSISSFVQSLQRNLDFSVDEASGQVVIKVIDRDSGDLVRQIPSEEALRLAERLKELRSLMFEAHA
ncbi:FlaG protein [compost metagenome]|uniref:Flagellar protein FlaG n=1 Tax=Pseudomonas jinjuensis TaxID=198616 RepID=A0A1H0I4I0_9PSED|nr:flagellar protein FlaG [Pseudomonas jinjuensis]SDO25991.1 flagellar protein FlaG [Pseudomonas jinjuensis]